jgi:1,4-alpha-glucan branching enzyme
MTQRRAAHRNTPPPESGASAQLGARLVRHAGRRGVRFAVWAPRAAAVSVVGSFNGWDASRQPMRRRGKSGTWETFVPEIGPGVRYRYHVEPGRGGAAGSKLDPVGVAVTLEPEPASIVHEPGRRRWSDAAWLRARSVRQASSRPLSIYQAYLGSWRRPGGRLPSYRELARTLVPYVKKLGCTHLELLSVPESLADGSGTEEVLGFCAPTSRHGSPEDFAFLVDHAHRTGIGVILAWGPGRIGGAPHGLACFDGAPLYERDPGDRQGQLEPRVFDLDRREVADFLLASALFWFGEYHVDGLRVDPVPSLLEHAVPVRPAEPPPDPEAAGETAAAAGFLARFTERVHRRFPGALLLTPGSSGWAGVTQPVRKKGLGFDWVWNRGWANDALSYVQVEPAARRYRQRQLTFSMVYAFTESFLLPLAQDSTESGNCSLLGKMPGDGEQQFANLRLLLGSMFAHPGKKLLFMGTEIAATRGWDPGSGLEWKLLERPEHAGVQSLVRDLNRLQAREPAFHEMDVSSHGFEWIDFRDDARSVIAFLRRGRDPEDFAVVIENWSAATHTDYRVGIPLPGRYRQLLNSDATRYGGGDRGVFRVLEASPEPAMRRPYSLVLTLPPLSILFLKPEPSAKSVRAGRKLRRAGRSPG